MPAASIARTAAVVSGAFFTSPLTRADMRDAGHGLRVTGRLLLAQLGAVAIALVVCGTAAGLIAIGNAQGRAAQPSPVAGIHR